jgi:hypothetical protein
MMSPTELEVQNRDREARGEERLKTLDATVFGCI